jgi:hypothetical protein
MRVYLPARSWRRGPGIRSVCDPDSRPPRRYGAVRVPCAGLRLVKVRIASPGGLGAPLEAVKVRSEQLIPLSARAAGAISAQQDHVGQRWPDGSPWLFPGMTGNDDSSKPYSHSAFIQQQAGVGWLCRPTALAGARPRASRGCPPLRCGLRGR